MELLCLCASHIDNIQRLSYFNYMIESWDCQKHKVKLYVSMSVETKLYETVIENNKKLLLKYDKLLYIFIHKNKKSQFQHYKWLTNKLNTKDAWIMFTDDDDIWHPYRTSNFNEAINRIKDEDNVLYISSPKHCIINNESNNNNNDNVKSFEDVFTLYEEGKIKIINSKDRDYNSYEHVGYSVRMPILYNFISRCNDFIINNKFCDQCFVKYLTYNKRNKMTLHENDDNWVYFYRYHNNSLCMKLIIDDEILNRIKSTLNIPDYFIKAVYNNIELFCSRYVNCSYQNYKIFSGGKDNVDEILYNFIVNLEEPNALINSPLLNH
jgi:hypothetical protein